MADRYQQLINTPIGRIVSQQVGLPAPVALERYEPGQPVIDGPVLLGAAAEGRASAAVAAVLAAIGAEVHTPMEQEVRTAAADARIDAKIFNPEVAPADQTFKAVVFDATGIASSDQLVQAFAFFHASIRRVRSCGRAIVVAGDPQHSESPMESVAQRALEGFVRSVAKELRRGASAQLICVAPGAEDRLESTLRFFLSRKAAYVSGQVVRIGSAGRRHRPRSTGSSRSRARSRSSPARRAGSARLSPPCSRATARTWSASTSRRSHPSSRPSPAASAAPRSPSTSPPRMRPRRSPRTCSSSTAASTSSSTTPASPATRRLGA